ncbi:hypothetical protein TNCV_4675861 [Trichonephila clavipes]|nr:hypothetical protein TNCV_4675861 [Trichonephila clavipes]
MFTVYILTSTLHPTTLTELFGKVLLGSYLTPGSTLASTQRAINSELVKIKPVLMMTLMLNQFFWTNTLKIKERSATANRWIRPSSKDKGRVSESYHVPRYRASNKEVQTL